MIRVGRHTLAARHSGISKGYHQNVQLGATRRESISKKSLTNDSAVARDRATRDIRARLRVAVAISAPRRATCTIIRKALFKIIIYGKRQAHTCRYSAALRKDGRRSWDTCTSPRYMNSRRDAILWALVPSRITISPAGEGGIPSKSS